MLIESWVGLADFWEVYVSLKWLFVGTKYRNDLSPWVFLFVGEQGVE